MDKNCRGMPINQQAAEFPKQTRNGGGQAGWQEGAAVQQPCTGGGPPSTQQAPSSTLGGIPAFHCWPPPGHGPSPSCLSPPNTPLPELLALAICRWRQ